ncbi:MAG: hypothetical protein KR126chlam3_01462 [Chlamydiae bacterium]|nr:hypothetical protein [Chlamydiota bacterium]
MKKAKIPIIFFSLIIASSALYAELRIPETPLQEKIDLEPHEDELLTVERMIALLEDQLVAQKKIKILIQEMRHNKEMFLKGEESKLHALYMIQAGKECLDLIRAHHLYHLFSSDFMEELAIFTKIGTKHE